MSRNEKMKFIRLIESSNLCVSEQKPSDILYLSSEQRTAVEPMNIAERLFGKFMN